MPMVDIFLGLGSNIERRRRIGSALDMLSTALGNLAMSSVYESAAVGFEGDPFYNMVVGVRSAITLPKLVALIKQIEDDNGRDRSGPKFGPRALDIDVLTYGDCVGVYHGVLLPRAEVVKNAYVLLPMAEIAPTRELPGSGGRTYQQLWQAYDKSKQPLSVVDFSWRGRVISPASS